MLHTFTAPEIHDLEAVLSAPRFATYLQAVNGDRHLAMNLYCWNTNISAAFYVLLQFCELSIRNGAVEALEVAFGQNWHLNRGFYHTLPRLKKGYQPAEDVKSCAARLPTAGKVVAELKFVFWQYPFVEGLDQRLWAPHFAKSFPSFDPSIPIPKARAQIHEDIRHIRFLRNRIAHHEPIFARNLAEDRDRIVTLVAARRASTGAWLDKAESVTRLLSQRPR